MENRRWTRAFHFDSVGIVIHPKQDHVDRFVNGIRETPNPPPAKPREDPFTDALLSSISKGNDALIARLHSSEYASTSAWVQEPAWATQRFSAAVRCADALLQGIVGFIETKAKEKGKKRGWGRITLGDIKVWATEGVKSAWSAEQREEAFKAVQLAEAAASSIWHGPLISHRVSDCPPGDDQGRPHAKCLAQLMGIVTAISVNKVVFEAQESYARRWDALGELFGILGLTWPRATVLLDPSSKSLAVYLCTASRFGERKYTVAVRRELALTDCLEAVQREGLGILADLVRDERPTGVKPFKMFPSFVDESLLPSASTTDKAAIVQAIVEKGEGHGPRKEFFLALGREMCGLVQGGKNALNSRTTGGTPAVPASNGRQGSFSYSSRHGSSLLPPFDNMGATKRSMNGVAATSVSQQQHNAIANSNTFSEFADTSMKLKGALFNQPSTPGSSSNNPSSGPRPLVLFSYVRSAGQYWLDRAQDTEGHGGMVPRLVGWLMGQCLANRSVLGVPLPPQLFQVLQVGCSQWRPSMASLRQFDLDAARSLEKLREVSRAELADFLEMEGLERTMTIEEYLEHSVKDYFCSGTLAALEEMKKGWDASVDVGVLTDCHVAPWDLADMICGPSNLGVLNSSMHGTVLPDLWTVFRVSEDAEVNELTPELYLTLRKVIAAFSPEHYRAFLRFVTGTDRLPLPGTELLRIEVPFTPLTPEEHEEILMKLPQAHTCDNTLEMPNYFESLCVIKGGTEPGLTDPDTRLGLVPALEQLLKEKLITAITSCDGYELDGTD